MLVYLAVLLRILSNPFANVFQKKLTGKGVHPLLINFLTYLLLSITCLFFAINIDWKSLPKDFWLYAVVGGILGSIGNGFLVKALQKGDLSVLGPINSYKSIVGLLFAVFLLNEIPNVWGILGVFIIIFGSYFVLDTTDERFSWALLKRKEIQFRLWAMVLTAIEAVFGKKIILLSSVSVAFVSWCFFGAAFSFVLMYIYRLNFKKEMSKISTGDYRHFLFLIACIGLMQFSTNYTFEHIPVGYALSLFQLSTLVSVLLGYQIFKEKDIRKKLLGSVIMIVGSVIIILLKG